MLAAFTLALPLCGNARVRTRHMRLFEFVSKLMQALFRHNSQAAHDFVYTQNNIFLTSTSLMLKHFDYSDTHTGHHPRS